MAAPYVSGGQSFSYQSVNQTNKTQTITYNWYVSSSTPGGYRIESYYGWGYSSSPNPGTTGNTGFSPTTVWNTGVSITNAACDDNVYTRHRGREADGVGGYDDAYRNGGPFQTWAADPTLGTPSLSGETTSQVVVDANWTPATKDTTVTAYVQYKKTVDEEWTQWSTAVDTGTGYSSISIDQTTVTGLDAETSYDFRVYVDRTGTANTTKAYYSSTATTSTLADTPSVTTVAASSVGIIGATLNATVDHNTKDGDLSWRYDTSDPGSADDTSGTEVDYVSNPITGDGSYAYTLGGLTASTQYWVWAIYEPDVGDKTYGAVLDFTTSADPGVEASDEDHMITQYVDAVYGATQLITFTLRSPSGTSSNDFYTGTAPVVATDSEVWLDGVSDGALDNAITQVADSTVAGNLVYSFTLSAAQATASVTDILIKDATATEAFRDHHIQVRTIQNLGRVVVNAENVATNTDAVTYTGNGSGAGLKCVAGDGDGKDIDADLNNHTLNYGTIAAYDSSTVFDLDNSTAVDTADYYNGAIILFTGGTGAGQARTIVDYVAGGEYRVTVNKALATAVDATTTYIIVPGPDQWNTGPTAELTTIPTYTSAYGDFLQFLFQRFAYERTQTATLFQMLKSDGTTPVFECAVDDDGTTQTHDGMADV